MRWACWRRRIDQHVPRGQAVEVVFERVRAQGADAATPGILRNMRLVQGETVVARGMATLAGLKAGMTVTVVAGDGLRPGTTVSAADPGRLVLSTPATATRDADLLFGGAMAPYAQTYQVEATVALRGLAAGAAVTLVLTVDDVARQTATLPAAGLPVQSFQIRGMLPAPAGGRLGLRVRQDGASDASLVGAPESSNFAFNALV